MSKKNILITGCCGTGKTWVMKELIKNLNCKKKVKLGTIEYRSNGNVNILGKYTGETFDGSDRLSMAVMKDLEPYLNYNKGKQTIAEGDRFTNKNFIQRTNPFIICIKGNGMEGRIKRGSNQSERHLKAIETRVRNIKADFYAENSKEALYKILSILDHENNRDTEETY